MSSSEVYHVDSNDLEWERPLRGYYLTDVRQKVLWRDEESGATVTLIKFPVGLADKVHSHPKANQMVYGLKGETEDEMGKSSSLTGSFTFTPKGVEHGATKFTKESILLFFWDGPPT